MWAATNCLSSTPATPCGDHRPADRRGAPGASLRRRHRRVELHLRRATWTQGLSDWIGAHTHVFAAIGGVPRLIVPDNAKVAVIKACLYEPQVNRTYAEMAAHYGAAVLPTRPRRPRDKAKVEACVLIVERWLISRLRNRVFHSLAELNAAIGELLSLPRRIKRVRVSIAFPASALSLSRPAQALLTLRPAGSLSRPRRPLSRGSSPSGCPAEPLVSYQTNRQLSGWIPLPQVMRPFGHGQLRTSAPYRK
jgi:hypothetical protein